MYVFCLLVISSVPQVIARVYLQHSVATGRMWRLLLIHMWLVIPLGIGYVTIVPELHSLGFAVTESLCLERICCSPGSDWATQRRLAGYRDTERPSTVA